MSKRSKFTVGVAIALSLFATAPARAEEKSENNQTVTELHGHEPSLPAPKFNTSVSSTYFNMDGSKAANNDLYSFGSYTIFSEDLKLQYTVAPGWTILLLAEYLSDSVVVNVGSKALPFETSGLGDTLLETVHPLVSKGAFALTADAGLSLPTGSIDEQNPYAPMHDAYFIQLGSGTFDGVLGLTSLYRGSFFTAGNRLFSEFRTGNNSNGYRLGNLYKAEGWLDVPVGYGFTPRITGFYRLKSSITGWDYTLPRQPLTEYYYHDQKNWVVAAALRYERPLWNRISVIAEADLPFYQGMSNYDDVAIRMNYYGSLTLNGQF